MTYRVYVGKRSVVVTEVRQIVFVSFNHIFLPNLIFLSLGQRRLLSLPPFNLLSHLVLDPANFTLMLTYFRFRFTDMLSRVKVSQIKSNFIFLSSGLSVPKDDKWLISISHGLSLVSIIISRPIIWKHIEVVWLARSVGMRECGLSRDGSFYCNVFYFFHHSFCVESWFVLCHMFKDRCKWAFMSATVIISIFILNESVRFLLYCVVRQMHKQIV